MEENRLQSSIYHDRSRIYASNLCAKLSAVYQIFILQVSVSLGQ